ncbi:MAG: hypothetical protein ACTSYD_06890 [Candidatus Heimdallarchaeaceae archaeon]
MSDVSISFLKTKPRDKGLSNIYKVKRFIEQEGMRISVRQAYYYLLTQGDIKESESSYKTLDEHLVWARKKGIIPWHYIDDGSRETYRLVTADNINDFLKEKIADYNRDIFRPGVQENFVLIFLEKDALKTPVWNAVFPLQVPIIVSRGYMSWGYFYNEIVRGYAEKYSPDIFNWVVLVLSDWDKEGEEMVDLLREMFDYFNIPVKHFEKIALTEAQLNDKVRYPNLRKLTLQLKRDEEGNISKRSLAKYKKWIEEHGMVYSELDNFTPTQLTELVKENVQRFIDLESAKSENMKRNIEIKLANKYLGNLPII